MLSLEHVSKAYEQDGKFLPVLSDVCLNVGEGEMCTVVGPSGSGKSTLLNIMGSLDSPDTGSVIFQGLSLHSASEQAKADFRNRQLGFVFQSFNLFPHLSALDNVGLPLLYRGLKKEERRHVARDMLEQVGLADRCAHRPDALSGGQRQRVAIARALVGCPKLILADEPTGNLDVESAGEVLSLLERLNQESGVSIVVITHDRTISSRFGREIRVDNGRVQDQRPAR